MIFALEEDEMKEEQELKKRMKNFEFAAKSTYFHHQWNMFCYNLIHNARFIPRKEDREFIDEVTDLLAKYFTVEVPVGSVFYRARIIPGWKLTVQKHIDYFGPDNEKMPVWIPRKSLIRGYSDPSDVGVPPVEKAGPNRASPKGIPDLYVTDNIYTAVSEVRPSILELVNVVEYVNPSPIKIIKLPRTGQDLKAMLIDDEDINIYLNATARELSFQFSRPIRRGDADLEYLPTQYLVNALRDKDASVQGISYPSFQSHVGMNFVIFSQDDLELQKKPERIIRVQNVVYDCCNVNDLSEQINPKHIDYRASLTEADVDEMKKQIVQNSERTE